MVTETAAETTEQSPEQQEELTPGLTESEASTPTEPEASTEPTPDDSVEGYLKERGLDVETKAESSEEGESEEQDTLRAALKAVTDDDARARLEAIIEERDQAAIAGQRYRDEQIHKAFTERVPRIEATLKGIMDGTIELTPGLAKVIVDQFNNHHADAQRFAKDPTVWQFSKSLYDAAAETLPAAQRGQFVSWRDAYEGIPVDATTKEAMKAALAAYKDVALKGHVTEAAAKKSASEAVTGYRDWLLEKPERIAALQSRAKAPEMNGGSVDSGGIPTLSTWQGWTLEQREDARKKDPQIEMKIAGRR